jgi:uncharacterized protein YdgA (DUF945 family)
MKKVFFIVLALFFLAAALLGGATFWFGMEAEQQYHDMVQQGSMIGYVHLTKESYSRGFFRSAARTVVEIRGPGAGKTAKDPLRFTLVHDIKHGPLALWKSVDGKRELKRVLAVIETGIELSPETKAKLKKAFGEFPETPPMKNYTVFFLGGNGETQLVIPAFQRTIGKDGKVTVDWKGLTAYAAFNTDSGTFTASLSAPGLEAVGEGGKIRMKSMESALDIHEGPSELSLGDTLFDVVLVEFSGKKNGETKHFSINGLKMKTSSQASNDTINYSMAVRIEQMMADDTPFGPGNYELELRKIDAASLAKLQQVAQEMQTQLHQYSAERLGQMMLAKYAEILPDLIRKSPEIEITQLGFKTSDGSFTGKAKIAFDGANAELLSNPLLLLAAVNANAEFTITDRLLQRILESSNRSEIMAAMKRGEVGLLSAEEINTLAAAKSDKRLETLVGKNILVHEDGNYRASADYRLGQVTLNGRLVSLQELVL